MKKNIFLSIIASGSMLFGNVNIKELDIYRNKIFVTQEIDFSKDNVNLIENIKYEDIRFLLNGVCSINSAEVIINNNSKDPLSKKIETLKEKIVLKKNEVLALKNSSKSLENISFSNNSVTLENIKKVNEYTKKQLTNDYDKSYFLEKEISKLNEELVKLIGRKNSQKYSKLKYDVSCEKKSKLFISYPLYSMQNNNFYEINANSKNNKIEIKNSSFITQSSGYNFENIDINLYSFNYTNSLNPIKFRPKYLDIYSQRDMVYQKASPVVMMQKSVKKVAKRVFDYSLEYKETQTKSFFKARNITLKTGIKNSVLFAQDSYKTKNVIEIDGYGYAKPFYKVKFKSDKLYGIQNARLYLNNIFISNYMQKELKKGKNNYIYFGEDRLIDIKKELIKDITEEPLFSLSKLKTEKKWKYEVSNNHKTLKEISLVERLPISKHEDIKVELITNTKYIKKDNGKILFNFNLKPNEKKIIEFGYVIEKPENN